MTVPGCAMPRHFSGTRRFPRLWPWEPTYRCDHSTVTGDIQFHTPAFDIDVIDTTGAGDVFHGASTPYLHPCTRQRGCDHRIEHPLISQAIGEVRHHLDVVGDGADEVAHVGTVIMF